MEFFATIPSSTLAFSVLPFLDSEDFLSLRATCSKGYAVFHKEEESEAIWKTALQRDFSIEDDCTETLRVKNLKDTALTRNRPLSVFGYPPSQCVVEASSPFESWKHWKKASVRYYKAPEEVDEVPPRRYLYGPYFLRAAAFWSKFENWCKSPEAGEIGRNILRSFQPGMCYFDWSEPLRLTGSRGLLACQAVYAFVGGQRHEQDVLENIDALLSGMLGGYYAYNYYSCTALRRPSRIINMGGDLVVQIAACTLSPHQGMIKLFGLHVSTGRVHFRCSGGTVPAVAANVSHADPFDCVLLWLEEYVARLESRSYRIGPMGTHPNDPQAILLYPQLPWRTNQDARAPTVSRAVTRGVEVVGSAVHTPQGGTSGLGYIYSIRIRLLTPEDGDEYVTPADRGFNTCQLQSRHWQINDHVAETCERVNGDGVIGMYPLLREGSYQEYEGMSAARTRSGESVLGTFSYQSCTSPMQGSFQGHLRFVPGSLEWPTGEPFNVEVAPFALDMEPAFLF